MYIPAFQYFSSVLKNKFSFQLLDVIFSHHVPGVIKCLHGWK